jgi:polyphosphate kinase
MHDAILPPAHASTGDADQFFNRDLSWLDFDARVLDQARGRDVPLLSRVKFLAIFGSNLDEFFMVRVSGLFEQLEADDPVTWPDRLSVPEQLARIRARALELTTEAHRLLHQELIPALAAARIRILKWQDLTSLQVAEGRRHFRKDVFPLLTPLAFDVIAPFPFLSNLSMSLVIETSDPVTGERRMVRVKVPESMARFVPVGTVDGGQIDLLPLEELIAGNLSDLLPGLRIERFYPFRVTRDLDMEVLEDEHADLLSRIDRTIRQRRLGAAVRLEITPDMPATLRDVLVRKLELDDTDVYEHPGPLGLAGLFSIASLPRPDLQDPPHVPVLAGAFWGPDPFAKIAAGDQLLHQPFASFEAVIELLRRAADDPDVLAIKMTLYRAGTNSEVVQSLIRAAENGKQVAVAIELKARFDEANNISWARAFGRSGVHAFFGTASLKVHAKVLLIVRRERGELVRYVHLGTGNYNASSAKIYTDLALFTRDEEIGEDACDLFNMLSSFSQPSSFRRLVVAPRFLRETLLQKIGEQAALARAGRAARLFAKVNSLVDEEVIRALYAASRAGVEIDLVVRGICCLRPGLPGVSERIRVRSLLGRFLEHERVYVFGPPGAEDFYIASADWMPRNLDRRVELMVPIQSEALRERIRRECMSPLTTHQGSIYELDATGTYRPVGRSPSAA